MHVSKWILLAGLVAIPGAIGVSAAAMPHANGQQTLEIPQALCAANLSSWLEQDAWPTHEVLLGDQIYNKNQLSQLGQDKAPLSLLGSALATAQLNLAAGAQPSVKLVNALFEADQYLVSGNEEKSTPDNKKTLRNLHATLNQFNHWAATASSCQFNF